MSEKSEINILITGGGSVMGQSIYKALNCSKYAEDIRLFYANSEPVCAAFYFNSTGFYKIPVLKNFIVPIAKDEAYLRTIKKICREEKIDLIFGGTEHEIYALAHLKEKKGYSDKVMGLPLKFVDITTDKYKLGLFFEKYGIAAPQTDLYSNVGAFVSKHGFPIIVKPRSSSASRHIQVVHCEEECPRVLFDAADKVLIQEYIGCQEDEFTVGCYLDAVSGKDSYIVMKRTLTVDGASGMGEVIADDKITGYCRKIMEAFKKDGFKGGAFNVQLRLRNGISPEAFEINGRFSSTEAPRAHVGFNALEAVLENFFFKRRYNELKPKIGCHFLRYYEEVYW